MVLSAAVRRHTLKQEAGTGIKDTLALNHYLGVKGLLELQK